MPGYSKLGPLHLCLWYQINWRWVYLPRWWGSNLYGMNSWICFELVVLHLMRVQSLNANFYVYKVIFASLKV